MWWVLIIPPAVWLGKAIYDVVTSKEEPHPRSRRRSARPRVVFEERGDLDGKKVVVIGRTGSGKSSLINMLHGKPVLAVGPIASTTRWIEGVRVGLGGREVVLVDTPGYGEVLTAGEYASGLRNWLRKHKSDISLVLLVIQADSKAHAEDKRILAQIVGDNPLVPVLIVLSQVDKLLPVRADLEGREWSPRRRSASLKSRHIDEKVREICEQFEFKEKSVSPASADGTPFNRRTLLKLIQDHSAG